MMITAVLLSSCATSKNIDHTGQLDYSEILQQMQSRMDSLLVNMHMQRKEVSEKLSNLKIDNKTIYYSLPDSTGKQYPMQVSETTVNKEDKENKTTDTELNVTIRQLVTEVSDLRQKLDAAILDKEKVQEVSWWDLHKMDVCAGAFALVVIGWIVCEKNKFKT